MSRIDWKREWLIKDECKSYIYLVRRLSFWSPGNLKHKLLYVYCHLQFTNTEGRANENGCMTFVKDVVFRSLLKSRSQISNFLPFNCITQVTMATKYIKQRNFANTCIWIQPLYQRYTWWVKDSLSYTGFIMLQNLGVGVGAMGHHFNFLITDPKLTKLGTINDCNKLYLILLLRFVISYDDIVTSFDLSCS